MEFLLLNLCYAIYLKEDLLYEIGNEAPQSVSFLDDSILIAHIWNEDAKFQLIYQDHAYDFNLLEVNQVKIKSLKISKRYAILTEMFPSLNLSIFSAKDKQFVVNKKSLSTQNAKNSQILALEDDTIIILWQEYHKNWQLFMSVMHTDGSTHKSGVRVSSFQGEDELKGLIIPGKYSFHIVWISQGNHSGIFAQRFSLIGDKQGQQFLISSEGIQIYQGNSFVVIEQYKGWYNVVDLIDYSNPIKSIKEYKEIQDWYFTRENQTFIIAVQQKEQLSGVQNIEIFKETDQCIVDHFFVNQNSYGGSFLYDSSYSNNLLTISYYNEFTKSVHISNYMIQKATSCERPKRMEYPQWVVQRKKSNDDDESSLTITIVLCFIVILIGIVTGAIILCIRQSQRRLKDHEEGIEISISDVIINQGIDS